MKRALLLTAAAAASLSLAACSKSTETTTAGAAQTASAATDKVQDTVGAAVGATSAAMSSRDTAAFVSNASQSDMYEIQAAKIAATRSKNPGIKAFAKMMVADHTATSTAMKPLAIAAGQTPADKLDERRQGFIDNLKSASDADFDKTYVNQQVAAHDEALTLMNGYAKDGPDAGLKGAAAKTAPKVQMHLDKIKGMQSAMKS